MTLEELSRQIGQKKSYLCVGLDPDVKKLPASIAPTFEGLSKFCFDILDATAPFAVACKLNSAFFEVWGGKGWDLLQALIQKSKELNLFAIADAKRADIGNTSQLYAQAFFEELGADALTLSPYMGQDSIDPFLQYPGKTAVLLALTSNSGSADFECLQLQNGSWLYEQVMETALKWPRKSDIMFVIGATKPDQMAAIRKNHPHAFFLVPGVGAQGGSLKAVSEAALIPDSGGILVNASRSILYASQGSDFRQAAAREARAMQEEMALYLPG